MNVYQTMLDRSKSIKGLEQGTERDVVYQDFGSQIGLKIRVREKTRYGRIRKENVSLSYENEGSAQNYDSHDAAYESIPPDCMFLRRNKTRKISLKNLKMVMNVKSFLNCNQSKKFGQTFIENSELGDGQKSQLKTYSKKCKKFSTPGALTRKYLGKAIRPVNSDEALESKKNKFTLPFVRRIEPRDKILSTLKYGEENIKLLEEKNTKVAECQANLSDETRSSNPTTTSHCSSNKSMGLRKSFQLEDSDDLLCQKNIAKRRSDKSKEDTGKPFLVPTTKDSGFNSQSFLQSYMSLNKSAQNMVEHQYENLPSTSTKFLDLCQKYELNNTSTPDSPQKFSEANNEYLESKGLSDGEAKPRRLRELRSNAKPKIAGLKDSRYKRNNSKNALNKFLNTIDSPKKARESIKVLHRSDRPIRKAIYSSLDLGSRLSALKFSGDGE
ncbi:unnamed protein product [Moneuplotes crassus]|uniref:Uncharacterized protein n=1 Tax=Euplotes crassus TaxID=5936 RepID=A0AAD1U2B1_EUPCR|nr:unnamed protein product [Moneuplotes crassus]